MKRSERKARSEMMKEAWADARLLARQHGGTAREYLHVTMTSDHLDRKAWARADELAKVTGGDAGDYYYTIRHNEPVRPIDRVPRCLQKAVLWMVYTIDMFTMWDKDERARIKDAYQAAMETL